jgi:DNA-binding transcriptional regulator LsrR (DeoR family)
MVGGDDVPADARSQPMASYADTMPDHILYNVCEQALRQGSPPTEIANWLREKGYPGAKREWIRKLLAEAFKRGIVQLSNAEHHELALRITRESGTLTSVSMVADDQDGALDQVAELAAERVCELIRQVWAAGRETEPARDEVHLGLAAGGTSSAFAHHLGRKLKREAAIPKLVLHALTSGFIVDTPESAPVVSLLHFATLVPPPQYLVLYSSPLASPAELLELKNRAFTREPFAAVDNLDIVVTSIAVAHHEHSLYQRAISEEDPRLAEQRLAQLKYLDWRGDIMWQPYSSRGTPIDIDVKAVSVVSFEDLVALAQARDEHSRKRHVVCIAGPCARCGEGKAKALEPLLRSPVGRRPFSHLVCSSSTAHEVCELLGWPG